MTGRISVSKRETPLTLAYWKTVGGTLCLEYPINHGFSDSGRRLLDGVILTDLPSEQKHHREVTVDGHDVVIVQTKDSRLGMYLLGQALFSREAIKAVASPRSIRTIALCTRDDLFMRTLAKQQGVEVVLIDRETHQISTFG
jgi:hypothetical protein